MKTIEKVLNKGYDNRDCQEVEIPQEIKDITVIRTLSQLASTQRSTIAKLENMVETAKTELDWLLNRITDIKKDQEGK